MKLLFLNTNIGYGGASKMIVWLANQCVQRGYDVTFLTYRSNEILQPVNPLVKLVYEQLEDFNGNGNILKSIVWLHRFIKNNKFDIGVAFLPPSILRMAIAAKGTTMKVLFSQRGDPYFKNPIQSFKSKVLRWLNYWAFNQADGYVFQTKNAQKYYSNAVQRRSTVIPNAISPMHRTEERAGNVRKSFVAVGRLCLKQKRQDLLIDAFNRISFRYPDFKLEIFGDGEDETRIKSMIANNPNIFLMGKTNNVVLSIQNAWATVLASDFEGIPNALLESMSLGVPSISTDCSPGGAAMLIQNKINGLLVPRGDAKSLAEAMEYMIIHKDKAEKMGKAGQKVNESFAESVIAEKWINFICSMRLSKNR